jgi:hypothetical protein
MSDIFLSYAAEDEERARPIAAALERAGWSVFWDRTIPYGENWVEVIGSKLDSARVVIVLWSTYSVTSRWVYEEAERARENGSLLPVLIDPVRPPMGFGTLQAAKLISWDGSDAARAFVELLAAITHKAPQRRQTNTQADAPASPISEPGIAADAASNASPRFSYRWGRVAAVIIGVVGIAALVVGLLSRETEVPALAGSVQGLADRGSKTPEDETSKAASIEGMSPQELTYDLLARAAFALGGSSAALPEGFARGDQEATYSLVHRLLLARGYEFDTRDGFINVVALRQFENPDKYDDVILLVSRSGSQARVEQYVASCDPGAYFSQNPLTDQGVARLMDGQFKYRLGTIRLVGKVPYQGLVSVAEQRIWRDTNRNDRFDAQDGVASGIFGLHIHAGGSNSAVGRASAGAQVIRGGKDGEPYRSFIRSLTAAPKDQSDFIYTLLTVPPSHRSSATPAASAGSDSASAATMGGTFAFQDFSTVDDLVFCGDAKRAAKALELTPLDRYKVGAVWFVRRIKVTQGFQTTFILGVRRTQRAYGSDGFAFVIQADRLAAMGGWGGDLGYNGIRRSLAVEFDMVSNLDLHDPDANHISIQTRYDQPNSANHGQPVSIGYSNDLAVNLADGSLHTAYIDYDGKTLSVYVDDRTAPVVKAAVDLRRVVGSEDGFAWVGLTAASGGWDQAHELRSWKLDANAPFERVEPDSRAIVRSWSKSDRQRCRIAQLD